MIFNIVADIKPGFNPDLFFSFNQVVGWSLANALEQKGHEINIVDVRDPEIGKVPICDHTIVTAGWSMKQIRKGEEYKRIIKENTRGKVCVYLDADLTQYDKWFDLVFTVVRPLTSSSDSYVYAGWGVNPDLLFIEEEGPWIFLDSYCSDLPGYGKMEPYYEIYDQVMSEKLYFDQPIRQYTKLRLKWYQMRPFIRRAHHYCCTQLGESGLPRLEASYCGAILVVPDIIYKERTFGDLEYRTWSTKKELKQILLEVPDREAIRKKAMNHTWEKVVTRILNAL